MTKQPQDNLTSLYPPPYSAKNLNPIHSEDKKEAYSMKQPNGFKDAFSEKRFSSNAPLGVPSIPVASQEDAPIDDKSSFWPILFLTIGSNLLMLGLLQLFFSDNGFLKLEWDSSYWFVYCLCAAPLVFLGFKKINQMK